ncbi:hypothetical protein SDC9_191790 [bioreactor metagenome]|uniref:Uncharacterized protein n=1 Tax=bioreactor metagenome TaxID=1076179 RepID=A0A645I1C0_9ZZZZ
MKIKYIYDELLRVVSAAGITVRKDALLRSRGGYCILEDNKLIILNKTLPIESHSSILARCIGELNLNNSDIFIAPAVRDYIENEISNNVSVENVEFVIEKKQEESTEE